MVDGAYNGLSGTPFSTGNFHRIFGIGSVYLFAILKYGFFSCQISPTTITKRTSPFM